MIHPTQAGLQATSTVGSALFAVMVILYRIKGAAKPVTLRKIIIPPLAMSSGFLMFLFPMTRIPWLWAVGAWAAGALFFSYPLIRTSRFVPSGREIYLERSKAFVVILLVLLAIRLLLHSYVERYVTLPQTGALFFLLAYGMLLPWRLAMAAQFRRLEAALR
ncbi:cytochrome c biogenesis protein CcdC [Paenibacillus aurantius]|uniref:Cytochrome c biogenesis protein CcdC n=1 Tax=Paenibacillus aurantius TaxID=2918900 RepID=A0AA96LIE1_9BACL|nr:cytochrome c biogenesis protein CcdC [Paenibacillus aurantius]WJH33115.1 cytochrome c biogenesis protein CcdC [Paenibacillus sp. CC-CFT747]WNQ13563.1 cytochrome c biogenesis protein CcdC [Paenibacillus aurantius]